MKKPKPSREEWLSLEQAAEALGVPWLTVWRWARDGDARLPAYETWAEGSRDQIGYRFRKDDVLALQEPRQRESAVPPSASESPSPDASRSLCQAAGSTVDATGQEGAEEDPAEPPDRAQVAPETAGPVTP